MLNDAYLQEAYERVKDLGNASGLYFTICNQCVYVYYKDTLLLNTVRNDLLETFNKGYVAGIQAALAGEAGLACVC